MSGPTAAVRPLPQVPRGADGRLDVDAILAAATGVLDRDDPRPRLLESVPGTPGTGRWSYVVAGTRGRVRWLRGTGAVGDGVLSGLGATGPFDALARACERVEVTPKGGTVTGSGAADDLPPFLGGLIGGFAYDLARAIEHLPTHAEADRTLPWYDLAAVDLFVAIDHLRDVALLVERPLGTPRTEDERARLQEAVAGARAMPEPPAPRPAGPARTSLPRDRYLAAVRDVLGHIGAGDAFQVNLSQRLTAPWRDDVSALYRRLRAASPAPYGAIVPAGAPSVASISPETFLHVRDGHVTVRPIKGTRPRHADATEDRRLRDELERSEKDRAENVMVVDMERNDLGRVCRPGSVAVPVLCEVEGHPTVWHLVSTVTGELRDGVGYAELLRATFPCGSVTGTPKVRAMELIERYEPLRRGWYCGAIGFLGDGQASLSVAIRTAVLHSRGAVDYSAGGGIVADSDPEAEHAESLDKAAAFLAAVCATQPGAGP